MAQPEHAEMLAWYRELIRLRRTTPCLNDGEPGHTRVFYDQQEKWLNVERGRITVVCNLGGAEHQFRVRESGHVVLASREGVTVRNESVALPPDTVAIISTNALHRN